MRLLLIIILIICSCSPKVDSVKKDDPQNQLTKTFFKNLNEGDTVTSPFVVEMGVSGMTIKPAGEVQAGTGHHHILVNKLFMNYGEIIPMDAQHLHYGKGDTIAELDLPQGTHQLTLQFANGMHMSYGKQFSNTITVHVK